MAFAARRPIVHAVHPSREQLTEARVRTLRSHGMLVGAYTVNDREEAQRLAKLGVDWLITDRAGEASTIATGLHLTYRVPGRFIRVCRYGREIDRSLYRINFATVLKAMRVQAGDRPRRAPAKPPRCGPWPARGPRHAVVALSPTSGKGRGRRFTPGVPVAKMTTGAAPGLANASS